MSDDFDEIVKEVDEKLEYLMKQGLSYNTSNRAIRIINELYADGVVTHSGLANLFMFGLEGQLNELVDRLAGRAAYRDKEPTYDNFVENDRREFEIALDELERVGFVEKDQKGELVYRLTEKGRHTLDPVWSKYEIISPLDFSPRM